MYTKYFNKWNGVKKSIQKNREEVFIRKGEVRWAYVGVNIGSEIDSKVSDNKLNLIKRHIDSFYKLSP